MIEVVFSNSAECSLRLAQTIGKGPYRHGCVGFAFEGNRKPSRIRQWLMTRQYHRRQKQAWERAVVLPGSGSDVFAFPLGLSMGDITPEHFWENREAFLEQNALLDLPPDASEQAKQKAQAHLETIRENLDQLCARVKSGEPMRIWIGTSADDRCVLAWLAAQMEDRGCTCSKVYVNQLPEKYDFPQGGAVSWNDWGEMKPEEWGILDRELRREAPDDFLPEQASLWHRLQQEHTALRTMENGVIRSVPADYYDDLIREEIARQPEEFHEAHVIGALVGTQLRMPDSWFAQRIELMIEAGTLQITWEETPGSRSYRRRLKKVHS